MKIRSPAIAKTIAKTLALLACALGLAVQALAQQPAFPQQPAAPFGAAPAVPAAAGAGVPGDGPDFTKALFLSFEQYSFSDHPFSQLTGTTEFDESSAGTGGTVVFGTPESDRDENVLAQLLHALPPFSLEFGWHTDFGFPKSISVGVDFIHVAEKDEEAISNAGITTAGLSRFEMDTYYIGIPVRFYGLPANQEGINFFAGFSLGVVSGNLLVRNADPSVIDKIVSFSQSGVGAARVGLDVMGKRFGMRYELFLLRASGVSFSENPFPGRSAETTLNFSGTILRVGAIYLF